VNGLDGILDTLTEQYGPGRIIEIGKIKIGGLGASRKARNGGDWRLPRKDDHFTITTLSRNTSGDLSTDDSLMDELASYADKDGFIRQIPIRVLSDDIDDIVQARFVWYGKKSAGAVSDGKTVTWYYDRATMKPCEPPVTEPWDAELLKLQCGDRPMFKLHANFSCVIAATEARWGGVYKFRTTSVISFRQLYASLIHISQLTGGILMGMPLMLVVRPMQVSPEGKTTSVFVVHVELRGRDLQKLQCIALEQAKFRLEFKDQIDRSKKAYQQLLVAPGEERGEEVDAIEQEFNPAGDPFESRVEAIRAAWLQSNGEALQGVNVRDAFCEYIGLTTKRSFDPFNVSEWTQADLLACENELFEDKSLQPS